MKVTLSLALIASASALAPAQDSRRAVFAKIAGAAAAAAPIAANAAVGESPRFSVFGLIGDGTSYSEGAAYGSDQASKVYSAYSVYGEASENSLYQPGRDADVDRKLAILAETDKRISKLPTYIEKKQWFNVKDELTRYMYETRGAVRGLAKTTKQKEAADAFFAAIEATYLNATLKKQDACAKAASDSASTLAAFLGSL